MSEKYFDQEHLQGYDWIEEELKIFEGCKNILDVGCGTGWFCKFLKESYPESNIIGTDIEDGRKFKNFDFFLAGIEKLPFKDLTFDGISCKAVLEHIHNPLLAVLEMNRVLKKDGILFISVPDAKDKNFWDDYTHVRPYTKKSLFGLLNDGGFKIEHYYYISSVPIMGILMKTLKIKNQSILKLFGKIGVFRSSLNVIVRK